MMIMVMQIGSLSSMSNNLFDDDRDNNDDNVGLMQISMIEIMMLLQAYHS